TRATREARARRGSGSRSGKTWNTRRFAWEKAVTAAEQLASPEIAARARPGVPPTLVDVARLAGVSVATASRVRPGSVRVRQQTIDKVQDAMTRLGYVRNRAPRSTTHRLAGAIALVFCEEAVKALADPFFERMVRSLSKALASADLQLILLTLHSPR